MKFGYTIVYTESVLQSIEFFENAFDLKRRFLHEGGDYGELDTGATILAFASHELGKSNFPGGYEKSNGPRPLGIEIALVTENVESAFSRAISRGATTLMNPKAKPWGQTVAYVRCPDGTLVELCTPVKS